MPDDQRWINLARIIESLSGQVRALADAGGREAERACGLEQAACRVQETVAYLAQRQGTRAGSTGDRHESNPDVRDNLTPEALTSKMGFKQWGRRCKLVAAAKDERFEVLPLRAESKKMSAPTVVSQSSSVLVAPRTCSKLAPACPGT